MKDILGGSMSAITGNKRVECPYNLRSNKHFKSENTTEEKVEVIYFNEGGPGYVRADIDEFSLVLVNKKPSFFHESDEALFDKIKQLSAKEDTEGLRDLAYDLFNCPGMKSNQSLALPESVRTLAYEWPHNDFKKIESLMKQGIKDYRDHYPTFYIDIEDRHKDLNNVKVNRAYFKKHAEEYVEVCHGGGYRHITQFLEGKAPGYGLENGGLGIQVGVGDDGGPFSRGYIYARRACRNFDTPAVLRGRIKYKYLEPAPNEYEAGITSRNIKYLENVTLNKV